MIRRPLFWIGWHHRPRRGARCAGALLGLLSAVIVIAGCTATTAADPPPRAAAAQAQTQAQAQTSRDVASTVGASQLGRASWYGGRYHGRKTASGERFDQNALTAAHRTLPFGSVVRVKNLKNGRSVEVRINDRGPFGRKTRIIDVSRAAATDLRMRKAGVVEVEITVVSLPAK